MTGGFLSSRLFGFILQSFRSQPYIYPTMFMYFKAGIIFSPHCGGSAFLTFSTVVLCEYECRLTFNDKNWNK